MAHNNTILRQIVALLPRHEFETLAKKHHVGQKFRSFSRWSQFMAMFIGQLSGRKSLRDLVMNVSAQATKFYHLAIKPFSRATLARVNEKQPASLYEAVFYTLLGRCHTVAPGHRFLGYYPGQSAAPKPNHPETSSTMAARLVDLYHWNADLIIRQADSWLVDHKSGSCLHWGRLPLARPALSPLPGSRNPDLYHPAGANPCPDLVWFFCTAVAGPAHTQIQHPHHCRCFHPAIDRFLPVFSGCRAAPG